MSTDFEAEMEKIRQRQRDAKAAGEPVRLTPTGPGYLAVGCPEDGCRWHIHYNDPAEMVIKFKAHQEEAHCEHVPS